MENEEIEILEEIPNKKKESKRPYFIAIILAILLVIVITTTSYAYFVATITKGTVNETVVTTGSLELEFTDGTAINLSNVIPGSYVVKTFKVENVGTGDTVYDVYMSDLINTFADKSDLVYTLTSADGGTNVSTQTQVPGINTKIVSNQLIRVGEEHNYTLRIDFLETNDNQNDNKGKKFSTIIRINEVREASVGYEVISGDLDTVGSVVRIGTEDFYVIGKQDSLHVKLFAKYNLGVGNGFQTPTNKQESTATGWVVEETCGNGQGTGKPPCPGSVSNPAIQYLNDYVTYLSSFNVNATARLITVEELDSIGCATNSYTCSSAPAWTHSTSYWTGSYWDTNSTLYVVYQGGTVFIDNFIDFFGVRPVIILEI